MRVVIFGAGKVGRSLARALRAAGVRVTLRAARRGPPTRPIDADLLLLAVRDGALAKLARELAVTRRTAVVHLAGALGPEVLAPLRGRSAGVGQAHPMISFASPTRVPDLGGGHLLVAGDRAAVARARRMARALGMTARAWPDVDRALYHAAGGLVANGATALAAAGAQLLVLAGAPERDVPRVLGPLLRSVAGNVAALGLPEALTGPVRRGDASAVRAHLERIRRDAPGLAQLYLAAARAQIPLAKALGDATPAALAQIEHVLEDAGPARNRRTASRSGDRGRLSLRRKASSR